MKWLAIDIVIFASLFGVYLMLFPSAMLRYRVTLEADVNGQRHIGSGVIQVWRQDTTAVFKSLGGTGFELTGEAVALDLGPHGTAFMILRSEDSADAAAWLPYVAFRSTISDNRIAGTRELAERKPKIELRFGRLPIMVRFRDITDPKTVELVRPDDFAASFGPGVTLVRATIEIVDAGVWPLNQLGLTGEPVSVGIAKKLPWLSALEKVGGALDGTRFPATNELRSNLGSLAFRRGTV